MTTPELPHLTRESVKREAQRFARHSRSLLAIYGTGETDSFHLEQKGTVLVTPVRSELDLRANLPAFEDEGLHAFLVPWSGSVPDDIAGRFVNNGLIYRVGPAAQLAGLTGASGATPEASQLVLAGYLLRADNKTKDYPSSVQMLDVRDLYEAWLRTDWGVPTEGGLANDTLLGWAAANGRGPQFAEAMQVPAATGLRAELLKHLEGRLGQVGIVIWKTWERGAGLELFGFALLSETLAEREENQVKYWLRHKLRIIAEPEADVDAQAIAELLGKLSRPSLAWLRRYDPNLTEIVVQAAERLVDDDEIRAFLIESTRLPTAWELKLQRLSARLVASAKKSTRKHQQATEEAWRALETHEYFTREDKTRLIERAEMCVRLAAWLSVRPDQTREGAPTSYGDVESLGSWYAEEGGYVDWARRTVRSLQTGPLSTGAQAIVEAADEAREELDRRFAAALEQWIHAGRPSKNVLPIDHALERIGARFLKGDEDRGLLVLLMDGMAWAQAVELLPSLGAAGRRWGPIAWHGLSENRIGTGSYPVMLAALPSVTEVSRAAFFAGKVPPPGSALSTAKDTERFAGNRAMQAFCEPHLKPRLLLRGEGHTSDGALSKEALHAIASVKEQRVVGLVVNAIDASLKGDPQHEPRWNVESIRSLPQIFDAAKEAGRHVLIAADHGHVPADRLKPLGAGDAGGARWRIWRDAGDSLQPGERKYTGEGVYVPKGYGAVVLLEDDSLRYGGGAHAGEHGGASLAEIVSPCLMLGWEDEVRAKQDPALALRGLFVPDWWTGALPQAATEPLRYAEPPARPKPKKKTVPENQMGLPLPAAAPPVPPSPPPVKPDLLLPDFYASQMLNARAKDSALRKKTVKAVHFLIERSGVAPAAAFAAHLNEPAFRVRGIVSTLQEVLNLDGYEVLRYDRDNHQIFLDKDKLEQQFEVKL